MSIDQDIADTEATPDVDALGSQLGEAIAELPAYREFEEARQVVRENDDLQEQIDAFEERRQEFMLARQSGEATQDDMLSLQQAQQELHDHPDMSRFLDAKSQLQDRLEDVNKAISEPLAVDFGGEAGGCCQDE
jgi:cell fate (sporulation/competence/biofilm development) regulator YlbF (YheA/YmcA/DUF963 family)